MSMRLLAVALMGLTVVMTVSVVKAESAKPVAKSIIQKSTQTKKAVVAKSGVKTAKTSAKPQAKVAVKPISPKSVPVATKPMKPTSLTNAGAPVTPPKAVDNARLVEVDGYRWMLPNVFAIPQHEVMQIPADSEKTSMVPLSMYSFSTPTSDQAFMSSFNTAELKDLATEQQKNVLASSKTSYIKTMNAPEELNSKFTTVQGHQAIMFDVKETTKSGTIFYSKVIGLLKPGGFYQFAFVSHQQDDLTQPWVQQVFDSIRFANETR